MFDIKKHLIKVQGGRQYLPVAARLIWFRTEHPDWGIDTKLITLDAEKQYAIFEATVYNSEGRLMAKGTKMENVRGFGDWLEKAETGAIGRALAVCGYGTQFAPDLDESHDTSGASVTSQYESSVYRNDNTSRHDFRQSSNGYDRTTYDSHDHTNTQPGENLAIVTNESIDSSSGHKADLEKNESNSNGSCESCSAQLKPSQSSLSLRKYGSALCPDCQRKRKADQAA